MSLLKILFLLLLSNFVHSQTVGTIINKVDSDKLSLLNPVRSNNSYLIDNCGVVYNKWQSEYLAGLSAYLDEHGNLYRAGRVGSVVFSSGGIGGVIEKFNWDGELLWEYKLANNTFHLHHDFEVLANGNILVLAWSFHTNDEVIALGRAPQLLSTDGFYSESIFEINPDNNFEVVWEWHALDHIYQTIDSMLPEYTSPGVINNRLDINLNTNFGPGHVDWLHANSIDYEPTLDQILLSFSGIDEIVVIDHSTTVSEAASSNGGLAQSGGDLLFRWGNIHNYLVDTSYQQSLFKQHSARWVYPREGELLGFSFFNNGRNNGIINFSTAELVEIGPVADYKHNIDSAHDLRPSWIYNETGNEDLYSKRMGSVQYLENDNILICEADKGVIKEVTSSGELVWHYVNPISNNTIFTQGDLPTLNTVFSVESYTFDFFESIELVSTEAKIELEPVSCPINFINESANGKRSYELQEFSGSIHISLKMSGHISVYNPFGALLSKKFVPSGVKHRLLDRNAESVKFIIVFIEFDNDTYDHLKLISK